MPVEAVLSVFEDINFLRYSYIVFLIVSLAYPTIHQLLKRFPNYKQLGSTTKQLVVLHHAIEAIILTTATPFFTYCMIKTSFIQEGEDGITSMANMKAYFTSAMVLCMCFMTMYFCELALRFESPRPVLIVHHLLATLDGFLVFLFPTTVMIKTCGVLCYFICFEALIFAGLFMYRIAPLNKHTPNIILSGVVIFAVTRPVQILWVAGAAFGPWNDPLHVKWQAILQVIITCLLSILQFWSVSINFGVWKRCLRNIKSHKESNTKNASDSSHMKGTADGSISSGSLNKADDRAENEDEEGFENETFEAFLKFVSIPSPDSPAKKASHDSPC